MKNNIIARLNDRRQLEKMYRTNTARFKQALSTLYPELKGHTLADCWNDCNDRLHYDHDEINQGTGR